MEEEEAGVEAAVDQSRACTVLQAPAPPLASHPVALLITSHLPRSPQRSSILPPVQARSKWSVECFIHFLGSIFARYGNDRRQSVQLIMFL